MKESEMNYRIVCTNQEPVNQPFSHAHIVAVGVGNDPNAASERLTLAQVLSMIDSGHTFFTKGTVSGKTADVEAVYCRLCNRRIIKTVADAVEDNNLDKMRGCQWAPRA